MMDKNSIDFNAYIVCLMTKHMLIARIVHEIASMCMQSILIGIQFVDTLVCGIVSFNSVL